MRSTRDEGHIYAGLRKPGPQKPANRSGAENADPHGFASQADLETLQRWGKVEAITSRFTLI